jgi:DNA primase
MPPSTITHTDRVRQDRIPDIRAGVDLVALVERYTGQHGLRDGVRLRWACPHPDHADTDPSFVVYARKQPPDFFCYGCGWGGDVITFVMGIKGLDKAGALDWLAACVGLDAPWPSPNREKPARTQPSVRRYTAAELEAFIQACHRALGKSVRTTTPRCGSC